MFSESPILVFQCLTRGASSRLNANNGRMDALLAGWSRISSLVSTHRSIC